jgi:hypothetical protein
VADAQAHPFHDACLSTVTFGSGDDDGGSASDSVLVLVGGIRAMCTTRDIADPVPAATDGVSRFRSALLPRDRRLHERRVQPGAERRDVTPAFDVLFVGGNDGRRSSSSTGSFLTTWLNFANGRLLYGQLVDTDGNGIVDTAFSDVIGAEASGLSPSSTAAQLDTQKDIFQRINEERGSQ